MDRILGDQPSLRERTETLSPIAWTRILISVPNGVELSRIEEALEEVIAAGGQVDYAGN